MLLDLLDRVVIWRYGNLALGILKVGLLMLLLRVLLRIILWILSGLLIRVLLGFVFSWVLEFRAWFFILFVVGVVAFFHPETFILFHYQ